MIDDWRLRSKGVVSIDDLSRYSNGDYFARACECCSSNSYWTNVVNCWGSIWLLRCYRI